MAVVEPDGSWLDAVNDCAGEKNDRDHEGFSGSDFCTLPANAKMTHPKLGGRENKLLPTLRRSIQPSISMLSS